MKPGPYPIIQFVRNSGYPRFCGGCKGKIAIGSNYFRVTLEDDKDLPDDQYSFYLHGSTCVKPTSEEDI